MRIIDENMLVIFSSKQCLALFTIVWRPAKRLTLGPHVNGPTVFKTMATEEENVELGHHQGLHGYGFGLAYVMDLKCTKTILGKELKELRFQGEILKDAILEEEY